MSAKLRIHIPMTGYTKLFGTIVASTIWREKNETRIVWITMLAMANKSGIVEASIPGLADMARVSLADCQEALKALSSPDEFSRTKDYDGRRIEEVDGGWAVLNHAKYRHKMSADERREYNAAIQRRYRAGKVPPVSTESANVSNGSVPSAMSAQEEAAPNAKAVKKAAPSNDDFIASLKTNPGYQHINIEAELGKMKAWIDRQGGRRQLTPKFALNWLNKIEAPLSFTPKSSLKTDDELRAELDAAELKAQAEWEASQK